MSSRAPKNFWDANEQKKMALGYAAPITLFILALIYKWFAVDDRYAIFLYNHMQAQPFDKVTVGRYWMTGLVASAIVMLLYIAANFLFARVVKNYRAPDWRRVWVWCAAPLTLGIVIITMTQNAPTMPLSIALAIVLATLIGLALALMPGALAAHRLRELIWSAIDGLGLVPILLFLRAIELPSRGLTINFATANAFAIGSIIIGVVWLASTNTFRVMRRIASPSTSQVFVAGLGWSYLVLPLVHHIFATPPDFKYITTAYNFFAYEPMLQAVTFVTAAILAIAATNLRERIFHQRGES